MSLGILFLLKGTRKTLKLTFSCWFLYRNIFLFCVVAKRNCLSFFQLSWIAWIVGQRTTQWSKTAKSQQGKHQNQQDIFFIPYVLTQERGESVIKVDKTSNRCLIWSNYVYLSRNPLLLLTYFHHLLDFTSSSW